MNTIVLTCGEKVLKTRCQDTDDLRILMAKMCNKLKHPKTLAHDHYKQDIEFTLDEHTQDILIYQAKECDNIITVEGEKVFFHGVPIKVIK